MIPAIAASGEPERLALLIRMRDGKEYLVPQDNLPHLVEFAKTFDAEIHRVALEDYDSVLDLSELPKALCDMHYRCEAKYTDLGKTVPARGEPIEHRVPGPRPEVLMNREMMRARAEMIRKHIREQILSGQVVSLHDLCDEFEGEGLSRTSMSNHLSRVRSELIEEGRTVIRIGAGKYQLDTQVFANFRRHTWTVYDRTFPTTANVNVNIEVPIPTAATDNPPPTVPTNGQWVVYDNLAN